MPGYALDDPRYLDSAADLDTVHRMLLEVASELWVTRDRLLLLEGALLERGLMTESEIEELAFDGEMSARLESERGLFLARLTGCVQDAPGQRKG